MADLPTSSMNVSINANLSVYNASTGLTTTKTLTKSLQLPIGDGDVRNSTITIGSGITNLGIGNTILIVSSGNINVIAGNSTVTNTKMFSYDGVSTTFRVSTTSTTPVSIDYIISTKAVSVPDAPVITGTTPGDGTVTVAFNPPNNGGSPITRYTVTSNPGNISKTATASPIAVTNLINGTPYTFTVTATNAIGTSTASSSSNSTTPVVPSNVPGAPTAIEVAKNSPTSVNVYFRAPAKTGGRPIIQYTVTSTPDNIVVNGTSSPITVRGVRVNTPYYFSVAASNANGKGANSALSNAIILRPEVPTAPMIMSATATGTTAQVQFTPPVNDGGSPITQYVVKSTPGNITGTGTSSPVTVSGLAVNTTYKFTMVANNVAGSSVASNLSNAVTTSYTTITVPSAPVAIEAVRATDTSVICNFPASLNTGGSPIIDYTIRSIPGNITAVGTASPITVGGLSPNTPYTFVVTARNSVGISVDSIPSGSVTLTPTPSTSVPGVPTITSITQTNDYVRVNFTPPSDTGGSPITSYVVSTSADDRYITGKTSTATSSPIDVRGLTYGTSYTFKIRAINSVGPGTWSAISAPVTLALTETAPSAPRNVELAKASTNSVNVYFSAPLSSGNGTIQSYTVYSIPDNISATGTQSPILVSNVDPFGTYHFAVYATNSNNIAGPRVVSTPTITLALV